MREIGKFRGKRLDNDKWAYGYYRYDAYKGIGQICEQKCRGDIDRPYWESYEVDPETVGQYTGLKDKNGNLIYEGDIVEFNACNKPERAVIEFQEHCYNAGFYPNKSTNGSCYWEVIGNIHSNPKLLEK